jgi:hypothetical protein
MADASSAKLLPLCHYKQSATERLAARRLAPGATSSDEIVAYAAAKSAADPSVRPGCAEGHASVSVRRLDRVSAAVYRRAHDGCESPDMFSRKSSFL